MIITILNNEDIVTLSIYSKSGYYNWWKQDSFGHYVTSIGLAYLPIHK